MVMGYENLQIKKLKYCYFTDEVIMHKTETNHVFKWPVETYDEYSSAAESTVVTLQQLITSENCISKLSVNFIL